MSPPTGVPSIQSECKLSIKTRNMSELQSSSSAADMAKQRREQRRRRLLMTSEERMRKIMGLSEGSTNISWAIIAAIY